MWPKMDLTTEDGMLSYLQKTYYPQCSKVEQLAGGSSGYVYRATTGAQDNTSVVLKHIEEVPARARSWTLDLKRMVRMPLPRPSG